MNTDTLIVAARLVIDHHDLGTLSPQPHESYSIESLRAAVHEEIAQSQSGDLFDSMGLLAVKPPVLRDPNHNQPRHSTRTVIDASGNYELPSEARDNAACRPSGR